PDSTRYNTSGIVFDFGKQGSIYLVSTDSKRLSITESLAEWTGDCAGQTNSVPAKAARVLLKVLEESGEASFSFSANAFSLKSGNSTISA
ncbi:hypothetical protein, partial [Klebsiella pneumoniae]|uniref:DNA polymerase III subunit beta family protein n=1 Tax=Klebsiella pneumoniae TaxID=573 RepID=UPI00263AD2C7